MPSGGFGTQYMSVKGIRRCQEGYALANYFSMLSEFWGTGKHVEYIYYKRVNIDITRNQ